MVSFGTVCTIAFGAMLALIVIQPSMVSKEISLAGIGTFPGGQSTGNFLLLAPE